MYAAIPTKDKGFASSLEIAMPVETVWSITVVYREEDFERLWAATSGDRDAAQEVAAIVRCDVRIAKGERPLCLCCEHEFVPGAPLPPKLVLVRRGDNQDGTDMAVCAACSEQHDDAALLNLAYRGVRPFFKTLRKIT